MKKESFIIYGLVVLFVAAMFAPLIYSPKPETTGLDSPFQQALSFADQSSPIAILKIYGPIQFSEQASVFQPPQSVDTWIQTLKNLEKNEDLKLLILRINSPGGTVGASQELYEAILNFKAKTNVPVIASIADIGTSGAYWISLAADQVFANPGSMVGNIGVILGNFNFEELAEKVGVKYNVFKSGEYKDFLSGWRPTTKNEAKLVQSMIDDIYNQFVATLMEGRNLSKDQAEALAKGQVFTGSQAKANGLIDEVGSLDAAITFGKQTYNLPPDAEPSMIKGNPFEQWLDSFGSMLSGSIFSGANLPFFSSVGKPAQPTLQ